MKKITLVLLMLLSISASAQKISFSHLGSPSDCRQENGFMSFLTQAIYDGQDGVISFQWNDQPISKMVKVSNGSLGLSNLKPGVFSNFVFKYTDKVSGKAVTISTDATATMPPYQEFSLKVTKFVHPNCSVRGSIDFEIGYGTDGDHILKYTYNYKEFQTNVKVEKGKFTFGNLRGGNYYNFSVTKGICTTYITDDIKLVEGGNIPRPEVIGGGTYCEGEKVTLKTNRTCPGKIIWSTGYGNNILTDSTITVGKNNASYEATCKVGECYSILSVPALIISKPAIDIKIINLKSSKSASKPTATSISDWSGNVLRAYDGRDINFTTESVPARFQFAQSEGPKFLTVYAETCSNLGTTGSLTFDMLATKNDGTMQSFNTHENNAPYFMYANRNGFEELYGPNHPAYGFYLDNGKGGNAYDAGLPDGKYKLSIRYWNEKGYGSIYPSTRKPQGKVLWYTEKWFLIETIKKCKGGSIGTTNTYYCKKSKSNSNYWVSQHRQSGKRRAAVDRSLGKNTRKYHIWYFRSLATTSRDVYTQICHFNRESGQNIVVKP